MLSIIQTADSTTLAEIKKELSLRRIGEFFILFGMGSQTDGLIFMTLADIEVFCVLANPKTVTVADVRQLKDIGLKGIVISGGPYSVHSTTEPVPFDREIFTLRVPVLGICLGCQMIAQFIGATVAPAKSGEFNPVLTVTVADHQAPLFLGLPLTFTLAQSHSDQITEHQNIHVTATSERGIVAAIESGHLHGIQGHPEVSHTKFGRTIFWNFCRGICEARDSFPVQDIAREKIVALRARIGTNRVVALLSGGVDSSVALELLHHAIGDSVGQVRAVYIGGLDRRGDCERVQKRYGNLPWLELKIVNARAEYIEALAPTRNGKERRLVVQRVYAAVAEREIADFNAAFVEQGTIYPDISESALSLANLAQNGIELVWPDANEIAHKAEIKLHHNMTRFSVPQLVPLADMVKDTVRVLGKNLGMNEDVLMQHPFPGSGLAVYIDRNVAVTEETLTMADHTNRIWTEWLRQCGKDAEIWQAHAEVTGSTVTLTKGDVNATGRVVRLCAAVSVNGFTATPYPFNVSDLAKVVALITSEVTGVGAVDLNITPKPPRTIVCC